VPPFRYVCVSCNSFCFCSVGIPSSSEVGWQMVEFPSGSWWKNIHHARIGIRATQSAFISVVRDICWFTPNVIKQRPLRWPVPCHLTSYSKNSSQHTELLAFMTRLGTFIYCAGINFVDILIRNYFGCQSHYKLSFSIGSLQDLSLLSLPQPLMAAFFVVFVIDTYRPPSDCSCHLNLIRSR